MELACRLTGWTQRAEGAYYGGIGSAAVCVARRKLRSCDRATAMTLKCLEDKFSKAPPVKERVDSSTTRLHGFAYRTWCR